jgi:hypothetical protein
LVKYWITFIVINCLSYSLRFWKKNPEYKIWYNSDHCINIPNYVVNPFPNKEFLPIEEFGFDYFYRWFEQRLINPEELKLLESYFIKDYRNKID